MKAVFKIQNLKCRGCANTIIKKLNLLENISEVKVDTNAQTVFFLYAGEADLETAKSALQRLGYPVEGEMNSLTQKAKSYVSCLTGRLNN